MYLCIIKEIFYVKVYEKNQVGTYPFWNRILMPKIIKNEQNSKIRGGTSYHPPTHVKWSAYTLIATKKT